MELSRPDDIYMYRLGAVWSRLLSLEALLRVAISGGRFTAPFGVAVGDEVEPDALNQWEFLSELIPKYNDLVARTCPVCHLVSADRIVILRNALAHGIQARIGRHGDPEPETPPPFRVIKFGRLNQKTGLVPVEFAADMTPEWFDQQESLLWEAQQTVARYLGTEGIGRPPA